MLSLCLLPAKQEALLLLNFLHKIKIRIVYFKNNTGGLL